MFDSFLVTMPVINEKWFWMKYEKTRNKMFVFSGTYHIKKTSKQESYQTNIKLETILFELKCY